MLVLEQGLALGRPAPSLGARINKALNATPSRSSTSSRTASVPLPTWKGSVGSRGHTPPPTPAEAVLLPLLYLSQGPWDPMSP